MNKSSRFNRHVHRGSALAAVTCTPGHGAVFTADEGTVPGNAQNTVNADRISFNYAAGSTRPWSVARSTATIPSRNGAILTKASFANGGAAVASQLNSLNGYGIYGIFTIMGTAAQAG